MSKFMVRRARDDFDAVLTAQGMERAGAEVISIAYDGEHQQPGAMVPCSKFVVFARVPHNVKIDEVDRCIDLMIDGVSEKSK